MCGIMGVMNGNRQQVERMLHRLKHRGPDGSGIVECGSAIHGHVRLALVDLTPLSAQPFRRSESVLSFNGEIWNFRELRGELEAKGDRFVSSGDTEVLAAMLDRSGLNCLSRLDGMFAFAWSKGEEHWLVRDRFGKIPLYVTRRADWYAWASERKAFKGGGQAIPPGHALNLKTGELRRWYQLPCPRELSERDLLEHLRHGVQTRLFADAPVCCLISGGLDSSLILALSHAIRPDVVAFTAVFDPASSDLASARKLCAELAVPLIEVPIPIDLRSVEKAIYCVETNLKSQIEIATLCIPLAERIYAEGFRACLSGEAADELFGGYGNFCIAASKASATEVIELRKKLLAKMARGNFIRCNKAFMAAGVECRLPFMEDALVEAAVQLDLDQSPLGKKLLKRAARELLPSWVIKRQKETFQGASGVSRRLASIIHDPKAYYRAELKRRFGYLPKD